MNLLQFYQKLTKAEDGTSLVLPAPIETSVDERDALAARLLLWLMEEMPDGATQVDLEDVLEAARLWAVFGASIINGEQDTTPESIQEFLTQPAGGADNGNKD